MRKGTGNNNNNNNNTAAKRAATSVRCYLKMKRSGEAPQQRMDGVIPFDILSITLMTEPGA
jgi:hypothetical protein